MKRIAAADPQVPTVKNLLPANIIWLHKIFIKAQGEPGFSNNPGETFIYVPDLTDAFYVTKNTLFKITLQATLHNPKGNMDQFVQILVNNHLIIGNKTVPNTKERINYGVGSNLFAVDAKGGYNHFSAMATTVPVMRVTFVYLRPGLYTFNVGIRSVYNTGEFYHGIMTFELTQFNDESLTSLGGYSLADVPTKGPLRKSTQII